MVACWQHSQEHCLKRLKVRIAVYGKPSQSYGVSLAVWDHAVLPATRVPENALVK